MSQLDKAICTDESISLVENSINGYYLVVTYFYPPPTKLREGNVFICVCLSVQKGPIWPLSMIPWTSPYSTDCPSPPPWYRSLPPLLETSSCQDQKPVQTCSIEHPPPLLISGGWLLKYVWWATVWYTSYWNAFLFRLHFTHKIHFTCNFYRPKRSFGQGNIFTRVCDSVHRGGGVPAPNFRGGGLLQIFGGGGCLLQIFGGGGLQFTEYGQRSAGTHPTGMHSCSK